MLSSPWGAFLSRRRKVRFDSWWTAGLSTNCIVDRPRLTCRPRLLSAIATCLKNGLASQTPLMLPLTGLEAPGSTSIEPLSLSKIASTRSLSLSRHHCLGWEKCTPRVKQASFPAIATRSAMTRRLEATRGSSLVSEVCRWDGVGLCLSVMRPCSEVD